MWINPPRASRIADFQEMVPRQTGFTYPGNGMPRWS